MRIIIALSLVSFSAFAINTRRIVASVASPIPSSYSASNTQSLVLSELSGSGKNIQFVSLLANGGRPTCIVNAESSQIAPSGPSGNDAGREIYLMASEPVAFLNISPGKNIYCKCNESACTSGELLIHIW